MRYSYHLYIICYIMHHVITIQQYINTIKNKIIRNNYWELSIIIFQKTKIKKTKSIRKSQPYVCSKGTTCSTVKSKCNSKPRTSKTAKITFMSFLLYPFSELWFYDSRNFTHKSCVAPAFIYIYSTPKLEKKTWTLEWKITFYGNKKQKKLKGKSLVILIICMFCLRVKW